MAFNETLAERIRKALAQKKGITEKKMFGGIDFLLNGNMLVGVWKDFLVVQLGEDDAEDALKERHVREVRIRGRMTKSWVFVDPPATEDDSRLRGWIQRAVKFVGKLPAKEKE